MLHIIVLLFYSPQISMELSIIHPNCFDCMMTPPETQSVPHPRTKIDSPIPSCIFLRQCYSVILPSFIEQRRACMQRLIHQ
jgi:hypothetical protein